MATTANEKRVWITARKLNVTAKWELAAGENGDAVLLDSATRKTFQVIFGGTGTIAIQSSNDGVTWDDIQGAITANQTVASDERVKYVRATKTGGTGTTTILMDAISE